MAARKSLSKLTLPTDIGNEERFLSHRQSLIQEKLLKCYAEEIACAISVLVVAMDVSLITLLRDNTLVL